MSTVPRRTRLPWREASSNACSKVRIAARRRPWATCMSASAIEQPSTSETWSICSNSTRQSVYDASATSRSPVDQAARPRRARAAPRARWSSSSATSSARRAYATVPSTSPRTRASPARWTAMSAGSRRNSSRSTTTIPVAATRLARVGVQPALGVSQQRLDTLERAGRHQRPRQAVAEDRPDPEDLVGEALEPGPDGRLAAVPAQGGRSPARSERPRSRSRRRPSRAGSPRTGRRSSRTSRWPAGAGRPTRSGCSSRSRACRTSANRWW